MLREAAEGIRERRDVDEDQASSSEGGSEVSSDLESEKGWHPENAEIETLTGAQRAALDAEADEEYEEDDLNYPWELMVRSCKLIENMPLTAHELQVMGWKNSDASESKAAADNGSAEYKEDEEEKDPRLANPAQVVLQKENEREGDERMSDVDLDDEGLIIHLDGEQDEQDWNNDYDPEDYRWDPEIPGKNGFLRNYYRRY